MKSHSITAYQSYALVVMTVIGVSVLILPRNIAQVVDTDGIWILVFPLLFTMGIVYLITKLCQRFPGKSFVELSEQITGSEKRKWVGQVFSLPFILSFTLVWFLVLAYITRAFGEVIVSTILPNTPLEVIMLTFIGTAALIASAAPEVLAKFNELLLPLIFVPLIFMLISFIQQGEIVYFLPLGQVDWLRVLKGSISLTYDFAGYSVIFIFATYYQQPQKAVKPHLLAMLTIGIFYWIVLTTTIGVFGVDEVRHMSWPTLEMVRVVDLPMQIFQRLESGMIALWMVASFSTVVNILAAFVEVVRRKCRYNPRARKWIALVSIPLVFVFGMIPKSIEALFRVAEITSRYILAVDILVPSLLLLIVWLRGKRGKADEKTAAS
jgi:spore germination protein